MSMHTISGLARACGVGVETVRYYQRRGLLTAPPRGAGFRHYGDEDIRRLRFIRSAQASGFTLEQVKELLSLEGTTNRKRARELTAARIRELDEKIAAMTWARQALKNLLRRCESGRGRCPIIPALDIPKAGPSAK
jgi:MerR family mercuric resistance operon transcriptional regulator